MSRISEQSTPVQQGSNDSEDATNGDEQDYNDETPRSEDDRESDCDEDADSDDNYSVETSRDSRVLKMTAKMLSGAYFSHFLLQRACDVGIKQADRIRHVKQNRLHRNSWQDGSQRGLKE